MLIGDFQSIEGLSRSVEAEEYYEGGKNDGPHLLFSKVNKTEVTFKTGEMDRDYLYLWMDGVEVGQEFKQDLVILQYTRNAWPLRIFLLSNCWPTKWKGADLDASQSRLPIEELTVLCDRVSMWVVPEVALDVAAAAAAAAAGGLESLGEWAGDALEAFDNEISEWVAGAGAIGDAVEDIAEWGGDAIETTAEEIGDWVADTIDDVEDSIDDAIDSLF